MRRRLNGQAAHLGRLVSVKNRPEATSHTPIGRTRWRMLLGISAVGPAAPCPWQREPVWYAGQSCDRV
jgi:hypothetical protein